MTQHITKFLLELGAGYAFVERQYHLEVGGQDFYMDLLFYHLRLRCYVVIELKRGKFLPEYAGKLNFYLSVVDDLLKTEHDKPRIGLLIWKDNFFPLCSTFTQTHSPFFLVSVIWTLIPVFRIPPVRFVSAVLQP